ncbi:hypothetical protein DSO57_1033522 [Entomophthora muscae]|uniref:Uncharacterized protein n=1 Tax=Entomophthora muscae TaxID=34485 RepID=A0ACC2UKS4_9FUNG|nr:hypothetical protein DSO57_1033522 [Entomophthora muscae]
MLGGNHDKLDDNLQVISELTNNINTCFTPLMTQIQDVTPCQDLKFFPLKTQAQEWNLIPDPGFLRAAGPMNQGLTRPRFPETKPLQAEAPAKSQSQNTSAGLIKIVPEEKLLKLPNGGRESSSVNFMNLKSSWVNNQI